nr:MAG: hypothetical protein EDM05_35635 [Leptolyngbya sp. IPPAS B-1204]RNJ64658.1 MAG: hypothetical protein EDM05_35345 [Leptolyngbya sp. IPPAS B-1204]
MNEPISPNGQEYGANGAPPPAKWRKATSCERKPPKGWTPVSPPNGENKAWNDADLWLIWSSAQSIQQTSSTISKLTWALFGLGTLLLLGSVIMAWTYPRVTHTNTSREVITTTKESNSIKDVSKDVSKDNYVDPRYYRPRALW